MNESASHEMRFIREVGALDFAAGDLAATLQALDDWRERLATDLLAQRLEKQGFHAQSLFARRIDSIHAMLRESARAWAQRRANLQAVQSLADSFGDKALLLVFGKFNAGKSAFCNFLADRFAASGQPVRYFHVEAGKIVATDERLREGSTETTSRLQGVVLGATLVLLDTPGLHSVARDNAALTQQFMDSADAVLWLTSSTSPGQMQELDALGHELRRGKVLMPIVTRSDAYEEDEVDGAIRKVLRNKSAAVRALQEADIAARAKEKLQSMGVAVTLLESPVSVSAYVAREAGQTAAAMQAAGFERLYASLRAMTASALRYKRRKHAEIVLHHLEEDVLGVLHATLLPALAALNEAAQQALDSLDECETRIVSSAWRGIVPALPEWLDTYADTRDIQALGDGLSRSIDAALAREVDAQLAEYAVEHGFATLDLDALQRTMGDAIDIDIDYQKLYGALQAVLHETLVRYAKYACEAARASIVQLTRHAAKLDACVKSHESTLAGLKARLRAQTA
ncbi:dynamin family protein [Paraburkholderia sp. J41]|uniref:dynamin family protein n=1 Tax=Paraburkholderia sp. J41 TaxID=2805433 RepID=UPI002AC332B9|nr:dynamin family protein [Paraburkholderia sp. J41]